MWPFTRKKDKKTKVAEVEQQEVSKAQPVENAEPSQEAISAEKTKSTKTSTKSATQKDEKSSVKPNAKPSTKVGTKKSIKTDEKQSKKSDDKSASKPVNEKEDDVEIKTRKSVYRVIFDKDDKLWKIKKDGAKRIIDSKKTKDEALARVQELSKSQDANFVVYKKDGKFQKKANLNLKSDSAEEK